MEQIGVQVASAVATKLITDVFTGGSGGGGASTPAAPKPEEPISMPTATSGEVQASKRRSIAAQIARRGRASTILTDTNTDKLGS